MEPIQVIHPKIPSPDNLPNPKSPWIVSQSLFDRVQLSADKGFYKTCELSSGDPEWSFIQQYFQTHKPNNRSIKRVCCIHNPDSTRQFEALIPSLEKEANMPTFAPKWQQEEEVLLRQTAMNRFDRLATSYTAPLISSNQRQTSYQNVTVLPLWHGTTAAICDSICKTGFAFFGKHQHIHGSGIADQNTDIGYFGSGIYFTNSARYAADIYSDGHLILAYVSMRKPYPVVADCSYPAKPLDMKKLEGLGAYQNYNAHYIPVISIDPANQKCAIYYPCEANQEPALDEFVVFHKTQTLARFWLELDIDLPKSLSSATTTTTIPTFEILLQKVLDLLESESIQQDQEICALLEGKSEILFTMNPHEALKEADLKFYNSALQLLDQSGKIRGIVKKRFLQIGQSAPASIAPHPHISKINAPQITQSTLQPIPQPPEISTPSPLEIYIKACELMQQSQYSKAIPLLKQAANQGCADAQNCLGICYHLGKGVAQDFAQGVKYYRLAADQGVANAQYNLGDCYYDGEGVTQDFAQAVKYYRLAAEQGNAIAQKMLGQCYYMGQGVTQDFAQAVEYFRLAAEQGVADAQGALGACYYDGKGVTQDFAQAVKYYCLAADQGHAKAQSNLGDLYYDGEGVTQDFAQAVKYYRLAAEQRNAYAQFWLGCCYYNGKGVIQDFAQALKYFHLAAEQGFAIAQCKLGHCYCNGQGITQDFAQAAKYFQLAAEQRHADAQCGLGYCYYNGKGVIQDFAQAMKYFRLAAEQGFVIAQCMLGICLQSGQGVTQDFAQAVKYYRLAAEQGYADAQYWLGRCYEQGEGVETDLNQAKHYYGLAADQGHTGSKTALSRLDGK